jgi:toxin CcdB
VARYDVYRTGEGLVVDVQTDLLYGLTTRLVVPLLSLNDGPIPAGRLNPVLDVLGELYALHPQLMGAVPTRELTRPIDNLKRHQDRISAAIDMIFLGF